MPKAQFMPSVPMRVLVIDDDPLLRRLLASTLTMAGLAVDLANDGAKGVASFLEYRQEVVVTDIIMPEQEGLETLLAIRSAAPNTKIIAMSGGGQIGATSFLELASVLGADATIGKPFRPSELIALIANVGLRSYNPLSCTLLRERVLAS